MVFAGRLGDQLGLRRVFLAGALLFIVSSAMVGAAQNIPWLITVRATQEAGAALMLPTTLAIVSAIFPERDRRRDLGIMRVLRLFRRA
jgi:MFS family permease